LLRQEARASNDTQALLLEERLERHYLSSSLRCLGRWLLSQQDTGAMGRLSKVLHKSCLPPQRRLFLFSEVVTTSKMMGRAALALRIHW
jgi:hypothetical protein